jgi:translation initiation factor 1
MKVQMNMRKQGAGGLVYSTEGGRMCPVCRKPLNDCECGRKSALPAAGDGVVRVSRETKGRGGKAVTVIRGLTLDADALAALGKRLRTACGAGGTLKDGVLEVQGDHCERVIAWLSDEGWRVKRAGG